MNQFKDNAGNKLRVLVVDDDRSLRFHSRHVLEACGLDVYEAEDGSQALDALKRGGFDTILLDVCMPGMDGFTACRELRRLTAGEFLPIIVVTGTDDSNALERAFQSGATDFATKPINWMKLKNRIRYLMNARLMSNDLVSTEKHRDALLDTIPDTILRMNMDGIVLDVKSPHYGFDITKFALRPGSCFHEALPAPAQKQSREAIAALLSGVRPQQFELELEQEGQLYFFDVRMVTAGNDELVAMLRDFSERHRAEAEIRKLAYYDQVTGLPNQELIRKKIPEHVSAAAGRAGMVSVMRLNMLGLDNAKSILGLDRTNQLFRILAQRLSALVAHGTDVVAEQPPLVGRVSEAGFAIVRNDFDSKDKMQHFAASMQQHIAEKIVLGGYEINLASRVGTATYPDDDMDGSGLLEKAEVVLEQANRTRHAGPLFYSTELGERSANRVRMSKKLQLAIENGDLYLEYQPKVDACSRNIIGVEALIRWHIPGYGPVSPTEFIPLAEESGLILAIGEFVLQEACRQSRRWSDDGYRVVPIAVNFSGHQFNQRGLVKGILNTLETYAVENENIEVELTESVALENSARVQSILGELRELGIRTAIDDFGTGYSSLSSLRKFQFHTLKIDRSFISDLNQIPRTGSIIEGIITMGHALDMKVVAEGVEEEHQLEFLRDQNCDVIQGYLTGKPVCGELLLKQLQVTDKGRGNGISSGNS